VQAKNPKNADSFVSCLQSLYRPSMKAQVADVLIINSHAMFTTTVNIIINCAFKPNQGELLISISTLRIWNVDGTKHTDKGIHRRWVNIPD